MHMPMAYRADHLPCTTEVSLPTATMVWQPHSSRRMGSGPRTSCEIGDARTAWMGITTRGHACGQSSTIAVKCSNRCSCRKPKIARSWPAQVAGVVQRRYTCMQSIWHPGRRVPGHTPIPTPATLHTAQTGSGRIVRARPSVESNPSCRPRSCCCMNASASNLSYHGGADAVHSTAPLPMRHQIVPHLQRRQVEPTSAPSPVQVPASYHLDGSRGPTLMSREMP
jgi:hypothetical protein